MPTDPVGDPDRSQPRSGTRHPRANSTKNQPPGHREGIEPAGSPIDPTLLDRTEMRAALDARDIGAVYRLLKHTGITQRQIAQLTGQAQSEVCEILHGRQVRDVWVLERIADGLAVPRGWIRLSYGEDTPDTPSAEEVDEDVKRCALLAATTTAALGQVIPGLGEPTDLALPLTRHCPRSWA